jgi:formylglycine-generating enzyme required for sulfatase activity
MKRKILGFLIVIMGIVSMAFGQSAGDYTSKTIGTLKYVPAGTFQRDATATNTSTVSAFRMSEKEITRAQFAAIMGTDPSVVMFSSGTSDPVQNVNWYHAIAFCNKLSLAEGFTPVYSVSGVNFTTLTYAAIPTTSNATWNAATANWSATGYRLPTEMEWMWAAMGATGGTTGYNKAFAGSTGVNLIGDYAVYGNWGTGAGRTTTERSNPVGSKLPNELGLYDMSGNVFEWNWDWYATYPTGAVIDYMGAASGALRVKRGGSWDGRASRCPVADRNFNSPYNQDFGIGFRVVRP